LQGLTQIAAKKGAPCCSPFAARISEDFRRLLDGRQRQDSDVRQSLLLDPFRIEHENFQWASSSGGATAHAIDLYSLRKAVPDHQ
jgi:hypothetical protein